MRVNFLRASICFVGGFGLPEPINLALWFISGIFSAMAIRNIFEQNNGSD